MTGKQRAIDLATKVAIINAVETGIETKSEPGSKCCRLATYQDVEEALFSWFKQARCMNVPISGPIMKIKAKELALKMGHSEFQCSTGWLERFKQL